MCSNVTLKEHSVRLKFAAMLLAIFTTGNVTLKERSVRLKFAAMLLAIFTTGNVTLKERSVRLKGLNLQTPRCFGDKGVH